MHTDADFLGLVPGDGPGRFHFTVDDRLGRLDGRLYGGAAIAISIAAAEEVSDRHALWMTTQFVSTVGQGDKVWVVAEVLAPGKRTNQVRVTGTGADGDVVFASLGATGRHRPDGLTGEFERAPTVSGPDDSDLWKGPFVDAAKAAGIELPARRNPGEGVGFETVIEMRAAAIIDHPDPGPGRMCLWVRRRDAAPITPALAAYMADMVPISIALAGEVLVGGTSLDNTIRIGSFVDSEWILLDLRPHLAVGDYGHGLAHVWSREGHLMATASQTASLFHLDLTRPPWGPAVT